MPPEKSAKLIVGSGQLLVVGLCMCTALWIPVLNIAYMIGPFDSRYALPNLFFLPGGVLAHFILILLTLVQIIDGVGSHLMLMQVGGFLANAVIIFVATIIGVRGKWSFLISLTTVAVFSILASLAAHILYTN